MQRNQQFVPIILGSDFNAYGMARGFYDEYGVKSEIYAIQMLSPVRYTKILNVHIMKKLKDRQNFAKILIDVATHYVEQNIKPILISCGDDYTELIAENKELLSQFYACPYADYETVTKLTDKEQFYQVCEQYGLDYPKTKIISQKQATEIESPFGYPVVLKGADSIGWRDLNFEGFEKVFIIKNQEQLSAAVTKCFANGYVGDLILQDFIPGDDSNMRTINIYCDKQQKVKLMCLGHPLLEDPSPQAIGNYVAILPDYDIKVYQRIKEFLEKIHYSGFVNLDIKYDRRDGSFKVLDLNPRQGRSSFYTTLNGYNLSKYPVEDYVFDTLKDRDVVFANRDMRQAKLWLGVSKKSFNAFATNNQYKKRAQQMIRNNMYGTTFDDPKDDNVKRRMLNIWMLKNYHRSFKRYFVEK